MLNLDKVFDAPRPHSTESVRTIVIRRPDDFHVHLRDGQMLKSVLGYTAAQFARAVVMPNLAPPITTIEQAVGYRDRILAALPAGSNFCPLMTCYLTDRSNADEIQQGFEQGAWVAAKLYPAGATTNAHQGVTDIAALSVVFERMERIGMPVLVHGECTDSEVDIFDRERVFMDTTCQPFLERHRDLKVVIEHVTTAEAVNLVRRYAPRVAGTITPHHLMINRTSIFQGGLRPHLYCLPVAKRERHRLALRQAATSGEACFFIGTDTAPHKRAAKESECGCAGAFVGATALQSYAQVFDEEGALDRLQAFASENGANFYGLSVNTGTVELVKKASRTISVVPVEEDEIVVFRGGEELPWSIGRVNAS